MKSRPILSQLVAIPPAWLSHSLIGSCSKELTRIVKNCTGDSRYTATIETMPAVEGNLNETLARCLQTNDARAWENFVHAAHGIVAAGIIRGLSRWGTPDRDQVDDLVQETFLKLCSAGFLVLRRFRSDHPNALSAYLRTIALTVVSDSLRSRNARKRGARETATSLDGVDAPAPDSTIQQAERAILLERVDKCLNTQQNRDRWIFWMYYRHGLTSRAISDIPAVKLGLSGVESTIHRLTEVVRKCLSVASLRIGTEKGKPDAIRP